MVPEPSSPAAPAAEPPSEDRSGNAFSRHVSRVADRLDERWPYAAVPLVLSVLLNGGVGGFTLALVVASPVGLVLPAATVSLCQELVDGDDGPYRNPTADRDRFDLSP